MIQVIVADLALAQADAIVRPADETLGPIGPCISRLDEQAGPRFAEQKRLGTPLKAGAAVVTGSGDLAAPFVLHVVIRDPDAKVNRDVVRRALVSAWQRATDWELGIVAAPLVGADSGELSAEEAATLLAETFPAHPQGFPSALHIVVERATDRELIEAIVRRIA
ncbi:MAG TPA: macro domain-containing protein [Gemmatimonadales bacterium]|nr:macro domain-containing protein [Gemmatimonadales bacterium]